jgi:CheY-specific phosphatase CheX
MKQILQDAVKNYLESIEAKLEECGGNLNLGFTSKISITGDKEYDIYVVLPKTKLDYVSNLWFGDDNYEIDDLSKEIANLIVGNAKVIAQNKGVNFTISTPEYLGEDIKIEYDDFLNFKFADECFHIAFKEK